MAESEQSQGDWSAVEMPDFTGRERHIEVSGTVIAVLTDRLFLQEARPQGINPKDLLLDLIDRRREPFSGTAMGSREVHWAHEISHRQYETVTVRQGKEIVAHVKVSEVLSLTAAETPSVSGD